MIISGILLFLIGALHSYLGERYILIRLFKGTELPKLFGSDLFTRRTLRFAWHLTTLAWWGLAAILFALAEGSVDFAHLLRIISVTFFASGLLALVLSRGKHLSWLVFGAVAILTWLAANRGA